MLLMGQQLIGKPILSLRTGGAVGTVLDIIVNPNNLKIEGWYAENAISKRRLVLLSQDIRDIIEQGFVVNDEESLTVPDELVRLESVMKLDFTVLDKTVVTQKKKRLGKVNDYAFESEGFFIQKLYVNQSLLKSFSGGSVIIGRTQIVEINDRKIVVRDATEPGKVTNVQPAVSASQPMPSPAQPVQQ